MGKLKITVNLECDRCSTKIQKVLCCIQEQCEFVIEKVEYEKDKVTVSGPFDANKLSCCLWAKAGRIIKNIEIVKEKKPEPKPKPKCKLVYSYPPCPQLGPCAGPCSCPTPPCPPPMPPACSAMPYPMLVCDCEDNPPCPQLGPCAWPCSCPTQSKPPPPKPPACQCPAWSSSCYCGGCQPCMPAPSPPEPPHYCGGGSGCQYPPCPQLGPCAGPCSCPTPPCPPPMPPACSAMPYPMLVCEDNPPTCAIM